MAIVNQNFKYLRRLRNWTQEEMAEKLGIKRSLLGAYEESRAEPRTDVLEIMSDMHRISIDDLLRRDLGSPKENYLQKRRQLKSSQKQLITFVPVKAAAGYLSGYSDEEFIEELNTFTLPMLTAGDYRAFEITGDSMLPIESGSVIVGHKIDGWEDIKNNVSYIVITKSEGIVYKRVLKSNRTKQKITLVSDNPHYEPYPVMLDQVLELWQTDAVISGVNQKQHVTVNHLADMVSHLQQQVSVLKKKVK
jgi:transcriptional regulator with XRE-family HTH domain